jgi:hypothetical protein
MPVTVLVRAAMVGSIRGAMVGLTVGMRGATLRLGRMIACADTCGMSIQTSDAPAASARSRRSCLHPPLDSISNQDLGIAPTGIRGQRLTARDSAG